jgi:hypothetical protein
LPTNEYGIEDGSVVGIQYEVGMFITGVKVDGKSEADGKVGLLKNDDGTFVITMELGYYDTLETKT